VVGKNVSSRLSVSPNYLGRGWTAHPEANGHVSLGQDFDLTGDVGVLIPFGGHTYSNPVYDARVGIDRRFGRLSLHAAFTSKGASRTVYHVHRSSRNALIFGVSYAL
jgi:hypothetical protein